ncbi:hypothetical protein ACI77F_00565 [Pseudomonas tritici]|uniref:hypothetical protein n=1 Tax=Pseudomonas tritici TaxID=2745518 RepID=UPI00387AF3F5
MSRLGDHPLVKANVENLKTGASGQVFLLRYFIAEAERFIKQAIVVRDWLATLGIAVKPHKYAF